MNKIGLHLQALLDKPVRKLDDCIGPEVKKAIEEMKPGDIILLENVRFHPEEEANDPEFCRQLAELADIYVNDAFGAAHRPHASTCGVAKLLPSYPGFLLEKEVTMLKQVLESQERPRIAIVGGAKVSDKLKLLENLMKRMDTIIIGGGMANTFLKAQGYDIGNSLCEDSLLETAAAILNHARERGVRILLPVDVVIADRFAEDAVYEVVPVDRVRDGWMIMDIGPETASLYSQAIKEARTILWNGPMGVYEFPAFSTGTDEVARAVAEARAVSVVGGGDSLAAVFHLGLQNKITHVSTGGGATLEFLEGKVLPGLENYDYLEQVG